IPRHLQSADWAARRTIREESDQGPQRFERPCVMRGRRPARSGGCLQASFREEDVPCRGEWTQLGPNRQPVETVDLAPTEEDCNRGATPPARRPGNVRAITRAEDRTAGLAERLRKGPPSLFETAPVCCRGGLTAPTGPRLLLMKGGLLLL